MSEEKPRRRRRRSRNRNRNRPPIIEEGGAQNGDVLGPDASSSDEDDGQASGEASASKGGRRRGARVPDAGSKPRTILGLPRTVFFMMAGLLVVILATTIAGQLADSNTDIEGVQRFSDQGRRHLADGEVFDEYNSFPPTSGPQAAQGVTPGVYGPEADDAAFQKAPSFAELLPILEQGGVVIYYDPGRLPAADAQQLRDVFVSQSRDAGLTLLTLVALDDTLPAAIVATAWRHALEIDLLDEAAQDLLREFHTPSPVGLYQRFVLNPPSVAPVVVEGS